MSTSQHRYKYLISITDYSASNQLALRNSSHHVKIRFSLRVHILCLHGFWKPHISLWMAPIHVFEHLWNLILYDFFFKIKFWTPFTNFGHLKEPPTYNFYWTHVLQINDLPNSFRSGIILGFGGILEGMDGGIEWFLISTKFNFG